MSGQAASRSTRVAVAATSRLATDAGLRLGELGGNAVDAALAATLVAFVAEPGVVSLAGGAFVTIDPGDGSPPVTVDGNVEMPGRGLPPERLGTGLTQVDTAYGGGLRLWIGPGSVATPGALAGLGLAHARYGRAPWAEVVAPAIEVARQGFPLGTAAASYLDLVLDIVFGWDAESAAALRHPDGRPVHAGETMFAPDLADALELVATEGARTMYDGALGAVLAADLAARGGLITAEDLAAYRAVVRPSVQVRLADWALATNPPPSIGGPVLAAMLTLLTRADYRPGRPSDVARLVSIQRAVLEHRLDVLDLAEDLGAAGRELLAMVDSGWDPVAHASASTVHISAVDEHGMACATTASAGYGSGATIPGTGILLNNCLGEPELNRRGVHALSPGTRLGSNMAPCVGRHSDGAVLAIGSPGADRITTALMQVLGGYALGGLTLQDAVDAPRLHVRHLADAPGGPDRRSRTGDTSGSPVRVDHEADLAIPDIGLPTYEHPARSMFFGGVAAAIRHEDGSLQAAADPRRAAAIAVSD
jgi:gamma-glutamyltranspeptidase / glutathione hydrolase